MDATHLDHTCGVAPREKRSGISGWWIAGGVAVVLMLANARSKRLEAEAAAEPSASPAELLRALTVATTRAPRVALLKRYQQAERLTQSGKWDAATSAAAEQRMSDFTGPAREAIARVFERDPFFKVQ